MSCFGFVDVFFGFLGSFLKFVRFVNVSFSVFFCYVIFFLSDSDFFHSFSIYIHCFSFLFLWFLLFLSRVSLE